MNLSLKPLVARFGRALLRSATAQSPNGLSNWIVPPMQSRWIAAGVAWYTPQMVQTIYQNACAGDLVSQFEMFDLMEATWPELSQCLNELKDSVVAHECEVVPWKLRGGEPTPEALRRARLVEELLWTMTPSPTADENDMEDTIRDLLDARGKGISVLEVDWTPRATSVGSALGPRATRWVHPNWYGYQHSELMLRTRPLSYGSTNALASAPGALTPFPPNQFLIGVCKNKTGHPLGSAMLHVLGPWWAAFNFTSDAFFDLAQIFGQPIRWATYSPTLSAGDKTKLGALLEGMGRSAWAMFPEGVQLELKEAMKNGSDNPQKVLLDTANKICRLLVLRQTLTSDVGDSGSRALGDVHQQTKEGVELACAKWACKTLQQLVRAIVMQNFGDDRECPWLKPCEAGEDPKQLADVLQVVKQAGLEPTDEELPDLGERLGFEVQRVAAAPPFGGGNLPLDGKMISGDGAPGQPEPEEDSTSDAPLEDATTGAGNATLKAKAAIAEQLGVPASWLNPLSDYLANIEAKCRDGSLTDSELQVFLMKAADRVPELFGKMDAQELAKVFESAMGQSVISAVRKGLRKPEKT